MPFVVSLVVLALAGCHGAPSVTVSPPEASTPAIVRAPLDARSDLAPLAPAEELVPDVRELGPGLGFLPIAPLLLLDTRGEALCGTAAPLGAERMHGPLKLELADCARVPLLADLRAVAITLSFTPRDANDPSTVAIGSRELVLAPARTTVHHLVAPTLGTAIVIHGDRATIDVTVELTAILAPDAEHLSRARFLAAPARVLDAAPSEHAIDLAPLAAELGLAPADVTGVIATARIAPTAPCAIAPFVVTIGPKDAAHATLARCERDDAWTRGVIVSAPGAQLALATDGHAPSVALDVIALLTSDRTQPAALAHLAPHPISVSVDVSEDRAVTLPITDAIAALADVHAWPVDRGTLEAGGTEIALAGDVHAWAPLAIDEDAIALSSTTPAVVDLELTTLFAID